jgi:hypothetical protein
MAKISLMPRRDGLQFGRLPLNWALPLVAALSIASWAAVIGVVCLVRPAISYLVGI